MKRILLIDDEKFTVKKMVEQLNATGRFDAILVESLSEGLDILTKKRLDLLILDIMMKNENVFEELVEAKSSGIEFIKGLRSNKLLKVVLKENTNIPIIVLTAITDRIAFAKLNQFDFLVKFRKPIGYQKLLDEIDNILKS